MTKRLFSLVIVAVIATTAWADGMATFSSKTVWTPDSYTGTDFSKDTSHGKSTSGTFAGTSDNWSTTAVLTCAGETSLSFNYSKPGRIYVVYGATTMTDGSFYIKVKKDGASGYTTVSETDMEGITYSGILGTRTDTYQFTLAETNAGLSGSGTVSLGGSQAYCIYAVLYVPSATEETSVSKATTWIFDGLTTGTTYSNVTGMDDSYYLRALSNGSVTRSWTVQEGAQSLTFGDGTTQAVKKYIQANGNLVNSSGKALAPTAVTTAGVEDAFAIPTLAFNATVAGTVFVKIRYEGTKVTEPGYRIYFANGDKEDHVSFTGSSNGTNTNIDEISYSSGGEGSFFITCTSEGAWSIYGVRFVPAGETGVTLTATTGTANRKDFKNLKVNNLPTGSTLYYILPSETATRTYTPNDSATINNVKKNGYLTYWVTDASGMSSERKKVAVGIAPTIKYASASTSTMTSTYTLSYTDGNTLYYTVPGGKEQTASGSTTQDVTIETTGTITAYQVTDDVTSPTLSTTVFAPMPDIEDDGKYNFSLLSKRVGTGYTIALGSYDWGEEVTLGSVKLKKPGPIAAKTLNRFAFTYENSDGSANTNWRLISDGRLRVTKRATKVYMAILDLKEGQYLTIDHNATVSLSVESGSTAALTDDVEALENGKSYKIKTAGHLLLGVSANSDKEFDITQIEVATTEKVTAPTLAERKENGEVVENAVSLTMGRSNFGNSVVAYYYTVNKDYENSSTETMSASGKITVDETCTIYAWCVSSTGVKSSISIYSVTLPEAANAKPVVYDFEEVVAEKDSLIFSGATAVRSVYLMEKGTEGWTEVKRSDFLPVRSFGEKVSIRAGSSSLTYDTENNTVRLLRAMAIHDLGKGDEIVIHYSGTGSLIYVGSPKGDIYTVNGKKLNAGDEISSGAVIKVTSTKYLNNYVVVNVSGEVYIKAIYINTEAPSIVTRPKVALKIIDGDEATYRFTFDKDSRLYYWLSTEEEEEFRGSDTGTYDLTISKSASLKAWAKLGRAVSDTLFTVIYAPTPSPTDQGDYDFAEPSEDLPADLEVTLDDRQRVHVEGVWLCKPTAMTARTFNGRFAFTETNITGKIKIRTNRHLAFNKGTDMNMAILGVKKGDIISFDYTGTIKFNDASKVKKDDSSASTRATTTLLMESGATYIVQEDGDILLNLELTDEAISIAKMFVAAAPGRSKSAAIDFATAGEEEEEIELAGASMVWCEGRDAMVKFKRLGNNSSDLPIKSKVSTENGYGENTTGGYKSGNRNMAIHALAVGDTIKVRYSGGTVFFYNHTDHGNQMSRNGKLLQSGDTIYSGDVLKVEKVDYLNNYAVIRLGSGAAISGIFINAQEKEKVLMPVITAKSSNTIQITGGVSTIGNRVTTNYTTNGSEPSLLNGTGGPYNSYEVQFVRGINLTIKAISVSETGAVSRIVTLLYEGTDLTPIDAVVADEEDMETTVYDLQGRKVTTMTPGHIYIINGKKRFYNTK